MDALHLATMRFHAAAEAEVAQLVGAWARPAAMRAAKPAVLAAARWWAPIACGGLTLVLCGATGGGCEWPTRSATIRPSSGFYAVLAALHSCERVSLFGLTSTPCAPFHYYGPNKSKCTLRVPKEHDEPMHWFEKEHEIYHEWQRQGRLRVFS